MQSHSVSRKQKASVFFLEDRGDLAIS